MQKRFSTLISCLLCFALLLSMAAPALAAAEDDALTEIVLDPGLTVPSTDEVSTDAPEGDAGDPYIQSSLPSGEAVFTDLPAASLLDVEGQTTSDPETVPINRYSGGNASILFDENWKFNYGEADGASTAVYNDSSWQLITLPHDFSIDLDYSTAYEAESAYLPGGVGWYRKSFLVDPSWTGKVVSIHFGGAYMDTEVYLNGTKLGENHYGYTPFDFVLPANVLNYGGENVLAVRVENQIPSSRWYSGSGLYRSVYLNVAGQVHVDHYGITTTTQNSGAMTAKTMVRNDSSSTASVTVKSEVYELDGATFEKKGAPVISDTTAAPSSITAGGTHEFTQTMTVPDVKLWSTWDKGTPNLYVLKTTVLVDGVETDVQETEFGFRSIDWDVNRGFQLNGVNVKLKGVCQHHDQGGLGAEAWYRAMERQVEILMDMGCNSIRVTHNPAADELIEICNRKGILVIDEIFDMWYKPKNGNTMDFARWFNVNMEADNQVLGGSADKTWAQFAIEATAGRDKNAPSVIMYSLGNEINTICSGPTDGFPPKSRELITWTTAADPTRPVTLGDNQQATDNSSWAGQINTNIFNGNGVVGHNYPAEGSVTRGHNNNWPMYSSETVSSVNSRGIYKNKGVYQPATKRISSYDNQWVPWGYSAAEGWWRTIRYDYNMGEYVWTGFDYLGEPTPWHSVNPNDPQGEWPSPKSSYFGIIDTNGIPKDSYYLYRAMWNDNDTTLHLLPTWDREDLGIVNGRVPVVVYSNAPVVRLYLNGKEVGAAKTTDNFAGESHHVYRTFSAAALKTSGTNTFQSASGYSSLYATFNVPYEAGTLEVKAFENETTTTPMTGTVGRSAVRTTTGAAKLAISVDRPVIKNDGRDLAYVTIDVLDDSGEIVNGAEPEIQVSVSGEGKFMAMDNGVQDDHTSFTSTTWKAGAGRLVAIVQSTKTAGTFTVSASSTGLSPVQVTVTTQGVDASGGGDTPVSYEISKTYYVQLGVAPTLPSTVTVTLGDGTSETKRVTWSGYDSTLLDEVGSEFAIRGTIDGYNIPISVGVVVLDKVAALLNYSTAVQVGTEPRLPDSRPAVMADGTVLTAQFPVTWEMPQAKEFNKAGTVKINGSAQVFGESLSVTAWVRVAQGEIIPTGNQAPSLDRLTLYPNVGSLTPADDAAQAAVQAVRDEEASTSWRGSGDLIFYSNTAIGLYQVKLTYKGSVPSSGVSVFTTVAQPEDNNWSPIEAVRTVSGNTVTYTLSKLASSVFTKLSFANEVDLAEAELIVGSTVFNLYSAADLDKLKVNGTEATSAQMTERLVNTSDATALVEAITSRNVAYTILPTNSDKQTLIVTESEDQSARSLYTVQADFHQLDANDSSNDYPYTDTTATAPSEHFSSGNEGDASKAVDNNENSYWHTGYEGSDTKPWDLRNEDDKRYIQLELNSEASLSALRYKPRPSVANGLVTKYEVWVSNADTVTEGSQVGFTKVAEGDWAYDTTWKIAQFNKVVSAKYVRLYGIETKGRPDVDPWNQYMSCAELRVVAADTRTDLSTAVVVVDPKTFAWKNLEICPGSGSEADQGTTVTVTLDGNTLVKDVDYHLVYSNNTDPGTAYIFAKAVEGGNYKGTAGTTFTIVKTDAKITSFEPRTVRTQAGIAPTLPDTVWACMSDSHHMSVPVIWDPVPEDYYIFPQKESYILKGHIEDADLLSDPSLQPELTVKVGWSQSVDGVSAVTAVGVAPALPKLVTVQFNDGTSGQRAVTWDLAGQTWNTPGTVTVEGTIQGIDRVTAAASVRVVEGGAPSNIALNSDANHATLPFPMASRSSSDTTDNPVYLVDSLRTGTLTGDGKKLWCNWAQGTYDTNPWVAVALAGQFSGSNAAAKTYTPENKIVSKVRMGFIEEAGTVGTNTAKVCYPTDYTVQYYTGDTSNLVFNTSKNANVNNSNWVNSPLLDDENWTDVVTKGTKPAIPASNTAWVEYEFEPVHAAILRVVLDAQPNQWTGMEELEIYGTDVPTANSTFSVSSIQVGDTIKRPTDFTGADNSLTIELAEGAAIPKLSVTTDSSNASVSITQAVRVPGMPEVGGAWAKATVTSEDGSHQESYLVKFTRHGAPDGYPITLDSPEADKLQLSASGGAEGTEITVTVPEGYELTDAWAIIEGGERDGEHLHVENGSFRMPAAPVRFSATATPIRYTITYDLAGGVEAGSNRHDYTIETPDIHLVNPTRSGYTFTGWTGTGLASPSTDVVIAQGSMGDRSYTANWKSNSGSTSSGGTGSSAGSPVEEKPAVNTDSSGNVSISLPATSGGKNVVLEMPPVTPGETAADASLISVATKSKAPVTVSIPVAGSASDSGTVVAVRVNEDGSETIVPLAVVTNNGMRVTVQDGDAFKLIDNKKDFDDVPDGHWAAEAVDFTASRELFLGLNTPKNFAPSVVMDRAMMVTVLWRMSERPSASVDNTFQDVATGAWYEEAVSWASEAGVVEGTGAGFDPNAPISREQLAVMLYRTAGSPIVIDDISSRYVDGASVSSWAAKAITWCVQNNILRGRSGNALAPRDTATRAEAAAMLQRYITLGQRPIF